MTRQEMEAIVRQITYPDYTFFIGDKNAVPYLQATYEEPDIITGKRALQATRKWLLSYHMVENEITQTALKLLLTSAEHRVREHFKYMGERVYGPILMYRR